MLIKTPKAFPLEQAEYIANKNIEKIFEGCDEYSALTKDAPFDEKFYS